jgi:hypothetical protein
MFKDVLAILDKGMEMDVDISVAREMVAVENEERRAEIEKAYIFISANYEAVTESYRLKAFKTLEAFCEKANG